MLRRLLPLVVALAAGLLALAWGLLALESIFVREREDARAALASRRRALEQYALESVRQTLRRKLESSTSAFDAALEDSLAPASGLYLFDRDAQLLPRLWRPAAGEQAPARELYDALGAGAQADEEGPWKERLGLLRRLEAALSRRDAARSEALLRAILFHRESFVVATAKDLPFMVRLLERTGPFPPLVEGIQRQLLLRRDRLTRPDFDFLRERIRRLSEQAGLPTDDFDARTRELAEAPLPLPTALSGPSLAGGWYLEPRPDGSIRGVTVDAEALVKELAAEMRDRGLLDAAGTVALLRQADAGWSVQVATPLWESAASDAERNFRLKTGLVAVCGAASPRVPANLEAEGGELELEGDPQLLRLLFSNLLRNACSYNTREPIQVRVQRQGPRILFSDNGVGIPEAEWERIFEEFVRLPSSAGRDVRGSGLGLALCRRIMALHGGSLRVAASGPGGTTFELTFPGARA